MPKDSFFDDEASESPGSDASTDEEGEFLSDGDQNGLHSSDLSENDQEEDEEEVEEEEEEEERGPRSMKRRMVTEKKRKHKHKRRRRRRLGDESSDREDEEDSGRDQRSGSRRHHASPPRRAHERPHRRKRDSVKHKKKKAISRKHAVPPERFERGDSDSAEISEEEPRRGKSSRRRSRSREENLSLHAGDAATPREKSIAKSKKKKRSLESYGSRETPRKSSRKTEKRKKRKTSGPALQHLEDKIEAAGFTFKLWKGRASPQDAIGASRPTQSFKVLINGRAHSVGLSKELLTERKVAINLKKPWVRYDAHSFTPAQVFNFLDNLKLSNLITPGECDYIKHPKKYEGTQPMAECFFLVIPHFRKEKEVLLFVVPEEAVQLASLWQATKMLDLAVTAEKDKAIALGKKLFEMNPPLACFNQKWPVIKEALLQVSPDQEDLGVMLRIFKEIEILGEDTLPPSAAAEEHSQHAAESQAEDKQAKVPQAPGHSQPSPPAPTTPVLLDHPLLSTLIQKQELADTTLQKILGVLEESNRILHEQSGALMKFLLQSKGHLDDIERAVDRSAPASVYPARTAQVSPSRSKQTSRSSPSKSNGVLGGGLSHAEPSPATREEPAATKRPEARQALVNAGAPSPQAVRKNAAASPLKANHSSQSLSEMLEKI